MALPTPFSEGPKFVQSEIANSGGRLEPTVAIVIHMDPSGNAKLRNWGRELAISILPIDGRIDIGEARDIEKQLSTQLFSHDPFDVTGPVSGDNQFFGRREQAIDLARKLQQGQIRSCLGIRKVGKTSIINRVLKEISSQFDCKTIMVDCSKDDIFELSAERLLYSIAETLKRMTKSGDNYQSGAGEHERVVREPHLFAHKINRRVAERDDMLDLHLHALARHGPQLGGCGERDLVPRDAKTSPGLDAHRTTSASALAALPESARSLAMKAGTSA